MKLNKLFWGLMVMALPLSFAACSSSDDDDVSDNTYTFNTPANKDTAARYTNTSSQPLQAGQTRTAFVEFGEDNAVVIKQEIKKQNASVKGFGTRAESDIEVVYIVGTYVKNGDIHIIYVKGKEWGTVTISNGGSKITVQEQGKAAENANVKKEQGSSTPLSDLICKTWKPFKTRLNFKKTTSENWIADELDGADFEAVKQRVNKEGDIIKDGFGDGYKVESIFFTKKGVFTIFFANGKQYIGDWNWNGNLTETSGDLHYNWWDEENMGCEYENGFAHIDVYTTGTYAGECWLRLQNEVKANSGEKWNVELVFRLQEAYR